MDSKKLFGIHQGSSEKCIFFAGRGVFSLDPPFNGRPRAQEILYIGYTGHFQKNIIPIPEVVLKCVIHRHPFHFWVKKDVYESVFLRTG
jgi:hypothetical protein